MLLNYQEGAPVSSLLLHLLSAALRTRPAGHSPVHLGLELL